MRITLSLSLPDRVFACTRLTDLRKGFGYLAGQFRTQLR
jgi:hypothetical protein